MTWIRYLTFWTLSFLILLKGYEATFPFLQAITSALATIPFSAGPITGLAGAKLIIGTKLLYYLGYFGRRSQSKSNPIKKQRPPSTNFPSGSMQSIPLPYARGGGAGGFPQGGGAGGFPQGGGAGGFPQGGGAGGFPQGGGAGGFPQAGLPYGGFDPAELYQALAAQGFDPVTAMQAMNMEGGGGGGGFGSFQNQPPFRSGAVSGNPDSSQFPSMPGGGGSLAFPPAAGGGGSSFPGGIGSAPAGGGGSSFPGGIGSAPGGGGFGNMPYDDSNSLPPSPGLDVGPQGGGGGGDSENDIESFFTFLRDMDDNTCISRLMCDIGADPSFLGDFSENINGIISSLDVMPSSGAYQYIAIMETGRREGNCAMRFPQCSDGAYEVVKSVAPTVDVPDNISSDMVNKL